MHTALLLIAHGSRVEDANEDLRELARRVRAASHYAIVEPSYLELAEPDIAGGAQRCIRQGAKRVIMLPYFLSAGLHVRRDLEAAQRRLQGLHADVEFLLADPIGQHPKMIEILLDRAKEMEG
jgi:sirohydrochlorin ferrochelatase